MVSQPGELIRLIYGEEPSAGDGAGNLDERLLRWADAFDAWLEERYTKFSRNVGPDSHRAWVEFLAFTRKEPWEVDVEEVEAFIEVLEERGLSAGTIQKRMTGLKSFYTFCQEKGIDRRCKAGSRSGSCGIKFNPAASARRPRVKQYAKANYLNLEEEEAPRGLGAGSSPQTNFRDATADFVLRSGQGWGEGEQGCGGAGDPSAPLRAGSGCRGGLGGYIGISGGIREVGID
jgi:hypothetical protein